MSKFLLILLGIVLFLVYIPFGFVVILLRGALEFLDIIMDAFDEAFNTIGELMGNRNDL